MSQEVKNIPLGPSALRALIKHHGGESFLEKVLEDFYSRMSQDVMLGFFFAGRNILEIAHKQKQFLLKAWGLTDEYHERPPARAHEDLPPILTGHFDRRLQILRETLKSNGLNDQEIKAWIDFESSFRDVVTK